MKRLQLSLFLKRFFQKRCNQVSSFWSHHLNFCQGYKTNFFKAKYGKQKEHHGCHVHAVGMIYVKAGITYKDDELGSYRLI